jgi:hypothetical protein
VPWRRRSNKVVGGGIVRAERAIVGLTLLALLGAAGCGGGGSSSGGGSNGMTGITWPMRDGEPSSTLPPSVETGRVVFESQSGESCCVAVDPSLLSGSSERGLAILNDLPPGPATVTVAGFTTTFAPTVPGILATCTTVPANAAHPCDPVQVEAPAFESDPLPVTILAGVQTNLGQVPMVAKPFLYDFTPAQDAEAPPPVQFALTVADAATNIQADSVGLEVMFMMPPPAVKLDTTPSPFRAITKRVTLALTPCADGSSMPCSGGALQLAGYVATGTAPELPEGPVVAHVTAANQGSPPQQLDFSYSFNVLATATALSTATSTVTPTVTVTRTSTATRTSTPTAQTGSAVAVGAKPNPGALANAIPAAPPAVPSDAIPSTPTATPTP